MAIKMVNKSKALKNLQQAFMAGVRAPSLDKRYPTLGFSLDWIEPSAIERFSIYRHNHRANLLKALAFIYPVCQRLVGESFFRLLGNQYIEVYPSEEISLNDYGIYFADFLKDFPNIAHLPYLAEVARLEWAIHQITLGPNTPCFDWHLLAAIPFAEQENLIFHRLENSVLFCSLFPVDRIWETNQPEFVGDDAVDLSVGGVNLLIWRKNFDIRLDKLTSRDEALLALLEGQLSLKELLNHKAVREQNLDVIAQLPRLIKDGYIANFSTACF